MNVMLIDDEVLSLEYLERLLAEIEDSVEEIGGIEVIGKFTNPQEGLRAVREKQPDVVFLDIEMPGVNGLQITSQLTREVPDIHIVFVTGHDQYALEAFDLDVTDYLLKPIRRERLISSIIRCTKKYYRKPAPVSEMICLFQQIQFKRSGQQLDVKWRTSKAKEIFAYLIHHREQYVRKGKLLELFYPKSELENDFMPLYTTIYQIRKTLEKTGFQISIKNLNESYKLTLSNVKIDTEEWEKKRKNLPSVTKDTLPKYLELIELYQNDYLADENYVWANGEQQRLRVLWLKIIEEVADYFVKNKSYKDAINLYLHMQEIHPYIEESYFMLMKLYDKVGDRHLTELQWMKLKEMMMNEYEEQPCTSMEAWYDEWKSENNGIIHMTNFKH